MQWNRGSQSPDVEDRRGESPVRAGIGGGGGGILSLIFSLVVSRFGIVGGLLVAGAFYLFTSVLNTGPSSDAPAPTQHSTADQSAPGKSDPRVAFVSFVLDDVQSTWTQIFAKQGKTYTHAKLVLFDGATETGCGYGQRASGPFYCPTDQHVYLDLQFFRELAQHLGAPGDFADAYVIAHEIGHHVQKQLGLIQKAQGATHPTGPDGSSVKTELQADCFAGVWANSTEKRAILEKGDLEQALNATAKIGDDRLQRMSAGTVQPEKWTHGSSAQRTTWFKKGFETGDPSACDTFHTALR